MNRGLCAWSVCLVLASAALLADARPRYFGCSGQWKVGTNVNGMGSGNTIGAASGDRDCTINGAPTSYKAGQQYTINVGCPGGFAGGRGCAHLFEVGSGTVGGGTCSNVNGRSSQFKSYTWTAPNDDS
eukprot:gene24676-35118_t